MTTQFDQTIADIQDYVTEQGLGTTGIAQFHGTHAYVEFDVDGTESELAFHADAITSRFANVTMSVAIEDHGAVLVGIIH
jgi:hypothetical protein